MEPNDRDVAREECLYYPKSNMNTEFHGMLCGEAMRGEINGGGGEGSVLLNCNGFNSVLCTVTQTPV